MVFLAHIKTGQKIAWNPWPVSIVSNSLTCFEEIAMNTNNIAHKDNCVYSLFIKPFTRKTSYAILIISSTYKMSVILSCKKNPVNLTRVNGIFFYRKRGELRWLKWNSSSCLDHTVQYCLTLKTLYHNMRTDFNEK